MAARNTASRARKSRSEVQQEFEKIREQAAQEKSELNPKLEELSRQRETEVKEALKDISTESVAVKISSLGIEISKTLAELSTKLSAETELLISLREAAALERKETEKLHKIDVAATSLDQLLEEYGQKKREFDEQAAQARAAWNSEESRRELQQKEYEENLKKQRQREKEEHEYQKAVERKKEQDEWDETQRLQERKNKEKQEALEKTWQARETALKEREDELNRLRKDVAEFPEKSRLEIQKAVAEAVKAAEAGHAQELVVLKKDAETEKRLSELKVRTLEETAARQSSQIEGLGQQLEEAKKQVQDIAIKAIEGASGAKALSHVSQLAMEQAKIRPSQG